MHSGKVPQIQLKELLHKFFQIDKLQAFPLISGESVLRSMELE